MGGELLAGAVTVVTVAGENVAELDAEALRQRLVQARGQRRGQPLGQLPVVATNAQGIDLRKVAPHLWG